MTGVDWIKLVVALLTVVATVVMAGATYYLAKITGRLANDTAGATRQADRHHQENLRPFCVITFPSASEEFPFGPAFAPESRLPPALPGVTGEQPSNPSILVRGELQNKGNGPAKDIFIYLNTRLGKDEAGAVRLTRPVFVSGLIASGETVMVEIEITDRDIMQAWNGERWVATQSFHAVAGQAYEIVVEYKDIFCNPFRTVHPRGIWTPSVQSVADSAMRSEMMVRPNRPAPIFLTGTQAVQTLADRHSD